LLLNHSGNPGVNVESDRIELNRILIHFLGNACGRVTPRRRQRVRAAILQQPLLPLQNRLFTPESQRQSRGQQYRRGVFDRAGHAKPRQAGNAQRARWDIRVGVGQVKN
jgi:hypothetical protein